LIEIPRANNMMFFGISDLHILLLLAMENMSEHQVFKFCLEAQKMAASEKGGSYLSVMTTKTAWGMQDEADAKASEILKDFFKENSF
jgi:hypothetical protein